VSDFVSYQYETLLVGIESGVATVTLNRPHHLNAFTSRMADELQSLWRAFRFDDDVRAIVLTGAGEKAFCTGIDRDSVIAQPSSPYMIDDPGTRLGPKAADLWKPVIGAVNGMACGGAFYLLGECEFLIAAEHASFFDPHVTFATVAAFEPIIMSNYLPFGEVMRMSIMGNFERISAQRALQVGLVSEVVPGPELLATAQEVAGVIASQAPAAIQGTLKAVWAARELGASAALAQAATILTLGNQPDALGAGNDSFKSGARIRWKLR
jgi:enoyl-CoA hydratase/carnithine racemase